MSPFYFNTLFISNDPKTRNLACLVPRNWSYEELLLLNDFYCHLIVYVNHLKYIKIPLAY